MSDDILEEFESPMEGRPGLPLRKRRDSWAVFAKKSAQRMRDKAERGIAQENGTERTTPSLPRIKWLERPDP